MSYDESNKVELMKMLPTSETKNIIDAREIILRRSIPIIINSFNQLAYLNNLIKKLLLARFENIYILDQGSSYPPLTKWLSGVYERKEALPLFLGRNNGPHYFFISELYKIFGGGPFVYTDPDISWNNLAPDFLSFLFDISEKYRIFKVGPALEIPEKSDIEDIKIEDEKGKFFTINEWESQFWKHEIEPGVYNSPIDTTFHLFVPQYYLPGTPLITGLRVSGNGRTVLHLPWHKSFLVPEEEREFYYKSTKHSRSLPAILRSLKK